MITVFFFGRMADVAGRRRVDIAVPDGGLRLLGLREQVLPGENGVRMSLNREVVHGDADVADGDEVAFFSVFSGG